MKTATLAKFSKRLVQYGALTSAFAFITEANGQIVYHDLMPDFGGPNGIDPIIYFDLDLDGDGMIDFTIRHRDGPSKGILDIIPGYSNAILGNNSNFSSTGPYLYPFALNSGDPISASANPMSSPNTSWNSSHRYQNMDFWGSCGNPGYKSFWCDTTDRYLGLRFIISNITGDFTHYGWARLSVDDMPHANWIIKDYAYNSTPDAPINAGQKSLGIDDNFASKIKVVALNKSIGLYNLPKAISYKLYNMTGQEILHGETDKNMYVIEANTLSSGIYILELDDTNSDAVLRKKLVL